MTPSLQTTQLLKLLKRWEKSPWQRGELSKWVFVNPNTDVSSLLPDDEVSFIPMESVEEKTGKFNILSRTFREVVTGYTRFAENDLICAKITPCMQNGKVAVVKGLLNGVGFGSTEFHVIRPKSKEVLIEFLWVVFTLESYLTAAQGAFAGSAGQQRLPEDFLNTLPLPLPPRENQIQMVREVENSRKAMIGKLAQADALLAGLDEFILEELGLTPPEEKEVKVFTSKLKDLSGVRIDPHFHHPNFKYLVDIIRTHPNDTLGNIVEFSNEQWNPRESHDDNFKYIEISGVDLLLGEATYTIVPVAEAPSRAKMIVKKGDIIISTTRPHRGAIALIKSELEGCIASTGFAVIRNINRSDIQREYLWCVLRTQICLKQMLQRSSGGNYPAITESELEKVIIPTPPESVQNSIIRGCQYKLDEARRLRAEVEKEWAAAKARFEAQLLGE